MSTVVSLSKSQAATPKRILVLYGSGYTPEEQQQHWGQISTTTSPATIEYMELDSFLNHPLQERYDQIIINAHGVFSNDEEASTREHHRVQFNKSDFIETCSVIKLCSPHTDKILLNSCFAGAVMKDLHENTEEGLGTATLVALGGSKHSTITYNSPTILAAKLFLDEDSLSLESHLSLTFPDTVAIRYPNGDIFKLGAVKTPENISITQKYTGDGLHPSRHICSPRTLCVDESQSWWKVNAVQRIDIANIPHDFKNAALGISCYKGHAKDAKYWLKMGADINCRLSSTGNTPLSLAVYRGHKDIVELLLEYPEISVDLPIYNGATPLLISMLMNVAVENIDIIYKLLAKLTPVELIKNLDRLILMQERLPDQCKEVGERLFPKIIAQLERTTADPEVSYREFVRVKDAMLELPGIIQSFSTLGWEVPEMAEKYLATSLGR